MKRINRDEVEEMLNKFVELRDKRKKVRSKKVQQEYEKYHAMCTSKLDYLVEIRTRKYKGFSNYDDLRQDGRLALMMALKSFDPSKGNFFCWANQYIKTKISREANRHSTLKIPIKRTKDMQPYKVSQLPIIVDEEPDGLEFTQVEQIKMRVREAIDNLPEDQQMIIKLHGYRSYSIGKICDELDISRSECTRLLNEAKESLKQDLELMEGA